MPVPLEFLRGALGVLCVFFAYMTGRSAVAVQRGRQKVSYLYRWLIRALICGIVLSLRHPVDSIDLGVWTISLAVFGLGWWGASHERQPEDLSHEMFPKNGEQDHPA